MKRRIILSIVLVLSVALLALTKSDSTVNAEKPQKFAWDTGLVSLGPNQILRVVSVDGELGGGLYGEVIKRFEYRQTACSGGICKHSIAAQTISPPLALAPNESASIDTQSGGLWRIVIVSSNRNLRVNALIIDTVTGEVTAFTTDLVIDVSG
jgi:hypothetical protein